MWSSGFLPGKYSGVALRAAGDPVLYVKNPGVNSDERRTMLDALSAERDHLSANSAILRSRTAFPNMRWPSACRRACRS
jgi:hypothetical protein